MIVHDFNTIKQKETFLTADKNGREINIFNLRDSVLIGESLFYPNPLFYCTLEKRLYTPLKERAMSLKGEDINSTYNSDVSDEYTETIVDPVFFFIYNTDNYYHFV